jgi:hypothetical protein
MEYCKHCGATKGAGGGHCPSQLVGGSHSFLTGSPESACKRCNTLIGGEGTACKSFNRAHEFV